MRPDRRTRYAVAHDLDSWKLDGWIAARGFVHRWDSEVADGNGGDFLLKLLDQHPTGELDVLDAGCGYGELTLALARRARSVVGLNRRAKLLELAGELLAESGLANVRFIQAALAGPRDPRPGGPLPLPHSSVDLVAEQRGPPLVRCVADLVRQLARSRAIIVGPHPAGTATCPGKPTSPCIARIACQYPALVSPRQESRRFTPSITSATTDPDLEMPT